MEVAWDEMANACEVMLREEGLEQGGTMTNVRECMIKDTLMVIGSAGFGVRVPWHIPRSNGDICGCRDIWTCSAVGLCADRSALCRVAEPCRKEYRVPDHPPPCKPSEIHTDRTHHSG